VDGNHITADFASEELSGKLSLDKIIQSPAALVLAQNKPPNKLLGG
jgi:hypothetical protein